jgi:hypothetical protein
MDTLGHAVFSCFQPLVLACVFAAINGPLETYGGASTSCWMSLHWHSVATPAADSATA